MNKNILFIIAFFIAGVAVGQVEYYEGNSADITIDFSTATKTINLPQNLKTGDFFQIRVENINLNRWKVLLNSKDTTLTTKMSTPTFADVQLDVITALASSLKSDTDLKLDTEITPEIQTQLKFVIPPRLEDEHVSVKSRELKEKLLAAERDINEKVDQNNTFTNELDQLKYNIMKKQLEAVDNSGSISMIFDFDDALKKIEYLRIEMLQFQQNLVREEKNYLTFSEGKKKEIEAEKVFKTIDKDIKSKYGSLKTNSTKMMEMVKAENAAAMLKSVLYLRDKDEDFVSLPIQFKKELSSVSMLFVPRDSLLREDQREIEFIFPTQKKNYWSIDASFYLSSLYDESYSSITTIISENEREVRFVEEDVTKMELGFASLLHYGWISDEQRKGIHISFGPGISISEKVRPRLLAGIGASLGNKHGFSIDLGGIAGFVEEKSNAFELNAVLSEVPESLTVSKLRFGGFLALGYIFRL
ncbi:hypothetical protein GTQ34_13860 [Muricauda sp. JGD-17]|uniref:Uncharacterized protein n=1 Tax=Flagellimonas ochracea TaxID=2696472 RepID=A0A964TDT1_9FLAO|nr:hypothetical protein [Allomuricauda ochracea]NAY93005.1 hypothetical protein [Allomuricauda ochracea]